MKTTMILAATLALLSAPALAQGRPGEVDGTLGNGINRSSAGPDTSGPVSSRAPGRAGEVDGTLGNGIARSSAVPGASGPVSSNAPGHGGAVDGTLGNGVARSSVAPRAPTSTGTLNPAVR